MKKTIQRKILNKFISTARRQVIFTRLDNYIAVRNIQKDQKYLSRIANENVTDIYTLFPKEIRKPVVGIVKSELIYFFGFTKYCDVNQIPYQEIDIHKSTFADQLLNIDILVWRTSSDYASQWEATDKVEFISDYLGKMTLPTKESLWFYEDKVREQWLFEYYRLPRIKTFISHSKDESMSFINSTNYPIVLKDRTCSSSEGVMLVKNKYQAKKLCEKIFSDGRRIFEPYIKQKGYVLFQEFVPNEGFDLRIVIVGNSYFGYFRYPKEKDFRASGSGIVRKEAIPMDVLQLAKHTKNCFPKSYMLAVDFLQDSRDKKYYIIETSIFISIETPEQLMVNGIPGRYIEKGDSFVFEEGRFWLPELMMDVIMQEWIVLQNSGKFINEKE